MIGFSAGALVAVATVLDPDAGRRPDFIGAIYGGLPESRDAPADAPPLFVAYANDDDLAREPCPRLQEAWLRAKRPVELHAYAAGGHGFGLIRQGLPSDGWADSFISWLRHWGFIPAGQAEISAR
jgi:dienelactone hydrolase